MKTKREYWKEGSGKGFFMEDGKRAMKYCIKCGKENYAMMVKEGTCVWCGFDANKDVNDV